MLGDLVPFLAEGRLQYAKLLETGVDGRVSIPSQTISGTRNATAAGAGTPLEALASASRTFPRFEAKAAHILDPDWEDFDSLAIK